jgi:hypothetical protein
MDIYERRQRLIVLIGMVSLIAYLLMAFVPWHFLAGIILTIKYFPYLYLFLITFEIALAISLALTGLCFACFLPRKK